MNVLKFQGTINNVKLTSTDDGTPAAAINITVSLRSQTMLDTLPELANTIGEGIVVEFTHNQLDLKFEEQLIDTTPEAEGTFIDPASANQIPLFDESD